jgi:signal transduction histidine kinase
MGEWAEQGRRLGTIGRAVGWWIGDWLRFGNERFGERYTRASRITGYDVQTLMNIVYVATSVEVERRRADLSFSHHAEVASLPPEQQDRWLDRARADHLSVRCLREELRRERRALRQESEPLPPGDRPTLASVTASQRDELVCPQCGCQIHSEAVPAVAAASQ